MTVCISLKKRKIERSKTQKFGRDVKQKETKQRSLKKVKQKIEKQKIGRD